MLEKRAQSAVEFTVILAVGLMILIGVLHIFFQANDSFSGQFESAKAKAAADAVADSAEMVYNQGAGSKTKIYMTMPANVNYINITDKIVLINFYSGGKARDVYRSLSFNISGSIPTDEGNLWLYFESKQGYVLISANATSSQ